ncbi:MAG TPA: zinc metalloprotease HtpX [Chloroflexota bacterium]|nr:zinc metalloprotease HtpX [Chloroflexota bacterium]
MAKRWYGRDFGLQARMGFTMLLLTLIYIVFSYILFRYTHLAIFFLIPLVGLFLQYFYSDKLVLSSVGARIVSRAQQPQLFDIVERLAQQADLPMPKIAIVDTPMPNAFATGRNPKHAVIAVTRGLLNQLPPAELEAVLAHEMTHIRSHDMIVMTMAGSVAAVAAWISQMGFWLGLGQGNNRNNGNNGLPFMVVLLITFAVAIISHLLVLTLSRYREYAADRGSALLTGQPELLESALIRISGNMQHIPTRDLREAQPLSALFIASPRKETLLELFSDHPSLEHRIARLQRLQTQMARS